MPKRGSNGLQDVKEQATTLAQAIIEQAANRAVYGADKARDAASTAKGRVKHAPKVKEEVVPSVRDVALQAATAALELWQAARERAGEVVETAEQVVAEPVSEAERKARSAAHLLAESADQVADRAKHVRKDVRKNVTVHADELGEMARDATKVVAVRADEVTERAKDVTKSAAEATVSTTRDTGATILWSLAAAGIVYYVLLDKDRREQVLKTAQSVIGQVREVIRDFQGYDEEFA